MEDAPPPGLISAWRRVVDVGGQVLGQVVGASEALAARLAVVGTLAGVDAKVARQIGFTAKGTAAK